MSETTIAKAVKTFGAPKGYSSSHRFKIEAKAYQLGGNQHPHFSVTGEIYRPGARDCEACGCLHEEAEKVWPAVKPIIGLHLSNADDGEPMHAVANGFYDLAGSVNHHFGERYHRGNSEMHFPIEPPTDKPWQNTEYRYPTEQECLAMLAEHLRTSLSEVYEIRAQCVAAFERGKNTVAMSAEVSPEAEKTRTKAGNVEAKKVFAAYCDTLRGQWKREAEEGIALIKKLGGGGNE